MNNGKNQYYAENFVLLVVQVLSTRSSCSTSPTSPTSLSQDYEKILCVQQQYVVRIWLSKHKETCYKPSHRTTNKHGETRYRLNCHEERCNRKRIHTHFLKDRNCEMQECQNYFGLYARDAQVKQYLQQQNLGELITAEDKVLIETCESWNNHRYAIVGQIWQRKDPWWNKTSQGRHGIISWNLALICEVDHGIIEKSKSTPHRSKKIWDCWIAVRWIEEGTFA